MTNVYLNNLKQHRTDKGWSQELVAKFSGVSSRTLQRIESGGATSIETAKSLAAVFELDSYLCLSSSEPEVSIIPNTPLSDGLNDKVKERSTLSNDVIESAVKEDERSWWEKHIAYDPIGVLVIAIISLVLMSARYLLPKSFSQEDVVFYMQFITTFNLIMMLIVMRKIMQGVGMWDEVCNMFRRYPQPVDHSLIVNCATSLVMALLLGLYAYALWLNSMYQMALSVY
jgi:transcriptional regulator with XRE-family HTH domain